MDLEFHLQSKIDQALRRDKYFIAKHMAKNLTKYILGQEG